MYESAVDVVVREGRGSCSLLQRCLGIGYGRAARLIDFMAEDGIVGPYNGSQAREVIISIADWEAMQSGASPEAPPTPPEPEASQKRRSNKIIPISDWTDENASSSQPTNIAADDNQRQPKQSAQSRRKSVSTQVDETVDDMEYEKVEYEDDDPDPEYEEEAEIETDAFEGEDYEDGEYEDDEYAEAEAGGEADDGEYEEVEYEEVDDEDYDDEDYDGEDYEEDDFDEEEYEAERA